MRVSRFYHPEALEVGAKAYLTENAGRHAGLVLRLKEKDKIILFNGDGCEYFAEITEIQKKKINVTILEKKNTHAESPLRLHLRQALSKSDKMDWVIQKAVELGVSEITPVISAYCAVKWNVKKMAHWAGIITSSAEQCGRSVLPVLNEPVSFETGLSDFNPQEKCGIIFDPRAEISLKQIKLVQHACELWIGPEGGFSEAEIEAAQKKGIQIAKLGPRVLRTETAAIAALSAMQLLYGDFH